MKSLLLALPLLLVSTCLKAQTSYPVLAMEVVNTPLYTDEEIGPTDTTLYHSEMLITLYDTSDIKNLIVKLGRTDGSSDLLSQTFEYDQPLSGQVSYNRDGYNISLGLGHHENMIRFYAEVIIERTDHSISSPTIFSR